MPKFSFNVTAGIRIEAHAHDEETARRSVKEWVESMPDGISYVGDVQDKPSVYVVDITND